MIFSLEFLGCFLLFAVVFNTLAPRWQNSALLVFNLAFVSFCGMYFAFILLLYSLLVHYLALVIHLRNKPAIYRASIAACLLFLGLFKYFALLKSQAAFVFAWLGFSDDFELIFALGLSFYVFASITYLSFIYHHNRAPVSYLCLLTYLSFFATFIAGPIFRFERFLRAYERPKHFYHSRLIAALLLFALTKKLALEPALYELLNAPLQSNSPSWLALFNSCLLYSFYLYFDFSAYTDLVSALALMIGIRLPRNFAYPLSARNLGDFWRRWHMSLSFFIRDFIYIKLGGNRAGKLRWIWAILCAFVLSGIWHGAGVSFALWGLAHALGLIFLRFFPWRLPRVFSSLICFFYVSLAWGVFYLNIDDLSALLALSHEDAIEQDRLIFGLCMGIFAVLYLCRGCIYVFARRACGNWLYLIAPIWLYAVLLVMPSGVPSFIYAGF